MLTIWPGNRPGLKVRKVARIAGRPSWLMIFVALALIAPCSQSDESTSLNWNRP